MSFSLFLSLSLSVYVCLSQYLFLYLYAQWLIDQSETIYTPALPARLDWWYYIVSVDRPKPTSVQFNLHSERMPSFQRGNISDCIEKIVSERVGCRTRRTTNSLSCLLYRQKEEHSSINKLINSKVYFTLPRYGYFFAWTSSRKTMFCLEYKQSKEYIPRI